MGGKNQFSIEVRPKRLYEQKKMKNERENKMRRFLILVGLGFEFIGLVLGGIFLGLLIRKSFGLKEGIGEGLGAIAGLLVALIITLQVLTKLYGTRK